MKVRCSWAGSDPLYIAYHDTEWGKPLHDSRALFELLCLEWQQAGLSWITILRRREGMREVYERFDPEKLASWDTRRIEEVLQDTRIIRNRLKAEAVVKNAKAFLVLAQAGISFADFLWNFAPKNRFAYRTTRTTACTESDDMAKALRKAGFSFCGSTICYAFMQASWMVNDHEEECFCYE